MFKLYTPNFLAVSNLHGITPSEQTQKRHEQALKTEPVNENEDVRKIYKKQFRGDLSLLSFKNQSVVVSRKLGSGGFAVVKKGMTSPSDECIAIKRIAFTARGVNPLFVEEDFEAEVVALKIMGYYRGHGVRMSGSQKKGYILTELHSGKTLFELIHEQCFSFEQAVKILLGTLLQLRRLHDHDPAYVHNDIKTRNIMVDMADPNSPKVKLIDFGACRRHGLGSQTFSGDFSSPAILTSATPRTFAMDMYSFGKVAEVLFASIEYDVRKENLQKIIDQCLVVHADDKTLCIQPIEKNLSRLLAGESPGRVSDRKTKVGCTLL